MLTLKDLENVDDGGSWKKLKKEVEAVTDNESQWLSQLTEIVWKGFIKRLREESTGKKKMITEKKGIKLGPGSGTHNSFQEENEDDLIRKQKKQKTENNDKMQKKKTCNNNEKKLKQKTGKQKKKKNLKKVVYPIVEPPPDMPEAFKNCIENLGGTEIKLVIQKFIQVTDLNPSQGRLAMTMNQVRSKFLSEADEEKLENTGVIEAVFVEPCLEVSKVKLTKWLLGQSYAYVFKTEWNRIVSNNADRLKPMAVVQIWSFRVGPESNLGFAMIKVRDGKDGHLII